MAALVEGYAAAKVMNPPVTRANLAPSRAPAPPAPAPYQPPAPPAPAPYQPPAPPAPLGKKGQTALIVLFIVAIIAGFIAWMVIQGSKLSSNQCNKSVHNSSESLQSKNSSQSLTSN
jgi:uncharacterized protein HemX